MTLQVDIGRDVAPTTRQRRWPWIVAVVAVLLAGWMTLAVQRLLQARDLAVQGLGRLEAVRERVDIDTIADGALIPDLEKAAGDFTSAQSRVRSPLVAPLRLVPWVGTQVRSADALSGSAKRVTEAVTEASTDIAGLAETSDAMDRATVAAEALAITRRTQDALAGMDLGPAGGLMNSLQDARQRFDAELSEVSDLLTEVESAAAGLAEFLEGPSTYLLLAANNSEMRAGAGSYLMAGTVRVANGGVEVGELRPTSEILLEPGSVQIQDEDLAARWGWLNVAADWRNLSPSPRFPANARLAADMWKELEGEDVDGVIVLDPIALSAIMAVTGPVDVDGRSIDANGVVRELLFDQYWEDDIDVRRDRLKEIAIAALRTVDDSAIDLVTLATGLQESAAARHMLAWSPHPVQQAAWRSVGIDGVLEADSVAVSVLNRGANKLDTFLVLDADLASETIGGERRITITLALHNQAQVVFPSYVLGPARAFGNEPGTYTGVLAVNLPAAALQPTFSPPATPAAMGPDGVSQVTGVLVEVAPGETLEYQLSFTLPADHSTLRIEPSARVPGIVWSAAGHRWVDGAAAVVDLVEGTVTGEIVQREIQPVTFDLDPIRNPVAPIPTVGVDGDVETTVVVSWQTLQDDPAIDVWERSAGAEWSLVGMDIAATSVALPERTRQSEYCYRTALSASPDHFSAVECLVVPVSVGYMRFQGDADDYFTAPDFVGSDALDVRVLVAPDQWRPDFWQMFVGQYDTNSNDRAWRFGVDVFDALVANFSEDGLTDLGENQSLPVSVQDGRRQWVRMTVDPQAGLLRFWVSDNGLEWFQLGDDHAFQPIGGLNQSAGPVYVGTDRPASDNPFAGKLYSLEVRDGLDGAIVAAVDFRTPDQQDGGPDRWIGRAGNVFTAHGIGWRYVPPES